MKKIIILVLFVILLSCVIFVEFISEPNPNVPIFKKEVVSSWIPTVQKFYLYDSDMKRHKVSQAVYDSYWLWSTAEGIYLTDEMAEIYNKKISAALGL